MTPALTPDEDDDLADLTAQGFVEEITECMESLVELGPTLKRSMKQRDLQSSQTEPHEILADLRDPAPLELLPSTTRTTPVVMPDLEDYWTLRIAEMPEVKIVGHREVGMNPDFVISHQQYLERRLRGDVAKVESATLPEIQLACWLGNLTTTLDSARGLPASGTTERGPFDPPNAAPWYDSDWQDWVLPAALYPMEAYSSVGVGPPYLAQSNFAGHEWHDLDFGEEGLWSTDNIESNTWRASWRTADSGYDSLFDLWPNSENGHDSGFQQMSLPYLSQVWVDPLSNSDSAYGSLQPSSVPPEHMSLDLSQVWVDPLSNSDSAYGSLQPSSVPPEHMSLPYLSQVWVDPLSNSDSAYGSLQPRSVPPEHSTKRKSEHPEHSTTEFPIYCDSCSQHFSSRNALKRHQSSKRHLRMHASSKERGVGLRPVPPSPRLPTLEEESEVAETNVTQKEVLELHGLQMPPPPKRDKHEAQTTAGGGATNPKYSLFEGPREDLNEEPSVTSKIDAENDESFNRELFNGGSTELKSAYQDSQIAPLTVKQQSIAGPVSAEITEPPTRPITLACLECRARKIRCKPTATGCRNCGRSKLPCTPYVYTV